MKDWREVSVCRRLCVVSMQHQDGRTYSLYKDTRHCTIYNTCCMMFNPIYKTAYYTMCSQYAYSLYKDRTIYETTYQTTHHTMYNPIYKTGYYTMCSQYGHKYTTQDGHKYTTQCVVRMQDGHKYTKQNGHKYTAPVLDGH